MGEGVLDDETVAGDQWNAVELRHGDQHAIGGVVMSRAGEARALQENGTRSWAGAAGGGGGEEAEAFTRLLA